MNTVARLIHIFTPSHYQLSLELQREERAFTGTVTIVGTLPVESKTITLHAKDLKITSASIDNAEVSTSSGDNDELHVTTIDALAAGSHEVKVSFEGKITDPMHGLYPCYYKVKNEKKELLMTQFESHHAREVFPCIDEPEAKATFDVTLTTETGITALSNMPVKNQIEKDSQLVTTFQTSPRMSTYLVAFVVGDLQKASATTNDGTEVNVWATHAQPATSLDFALDTAVRTIEFFNDYFGTPYPLPKADHVAVPDFSAGAMENWGLITYREACLLVDPKTTAVSSREYIASVIVHELSHQWFGNLVTMKWWDDLWLNESFASLMEYVGVDALYPDWNVWMNFTTSESLPSLRRDSLPGVQAIKTDVHHPDEISTLFDPSIVYAKGARILRMLREYIGEDAFRNGLKAYFATHAYKNTIGDDLWEAFGTAANKDIKDFMKQWLEVSGFPVVSASLRGKELHLTQSQFLIGEAPDTNKIWPIPLNANQATIPPLMNERSLTAQVTPDTYVKLNQQDTAHFITHYDDALRAKLIAAVASDELPAADRLQLLHEASLLPRAGIGATAHLIPLLEVYKHETKEPVWEVIALVATELRRFVETHTAAEDSLKKLSASLARALYEQLGWEESPGEAESDTKLRATVIAMMIYAEDSEAIAEALKRYDTATEISDLNSELASLILTAAVRHHPSKQMVIERLLRLYATTSSSDIQQDITTALTSTRDTTVIAHLLENLSNTEIVRPQDTPRWFAYLIRNRYGKKQAWQWLRDNWNWVESAFKSDKSYDIFPRYAAMALETREQLKEYTTFFTPLMKQPALTRAIEVGINEIEGRVAWLDRDRAEVIAHLEALK